MSTKFTADENLFGVGAPFFPLSYMATMAGTGEYHNGLFTFTINDISRIDIATLVAFVNAGGVVVDYPVFIVVDAADYGDPVPAYMPNRVYQTIDADDLDAVPVDHVRTWAQWKDNIHNHAVGLNGTYVVDGASFGVELEGDVIAALYADGYVLAPPSGYAALLPVPEEVSE